VAFYCACMAHCMPSVAPALCVMLAVDLTCHAVNSATDEKENIQRWLRTRHSTQWTDPKTNQKLTTNRLTPNFSLRSMIQQWREENPHYSD
jgi:hypothetical protein